MDDDVFAKLTQKAKAAGLHSISLYLLQKASGLPSDSARAANLCRKALLHVKKQPINQPFEVKSLLSTEWKQQSTGVKLRIGKLFIEEVSKGNYNIKILQKNSANHQRYERTG